MRRISYYLQGLYKSSIRYSPQLYGLNALNSSISRNAHRPLFTSSPFSTPSFTLFQQSMQHNAATITTLIPSIRTISTTTINKNKEAAKITLGDMEDKQDDKQDDKHNDKHNDKHMNDKKKEVEEVRTGTTNTH